MSEYCLNCGTELNCLDEDPNGDRNVVCAKCRAEDDHDFDAEPDVRFGRDGRLVEAEPSRSGDEGPVCVGCRKSREEEAGVCSACGAETEVQFLPLHIIGSEGTWLCHSCKMTVIGVIRGMRSAAGRAVVAHRKRQRRHGKGIMTGTSERMTVDEMVRERVRAHLRGDWPRMAELDLAGQDYTNHGYWTKVQTLSPLSDDELREWLDEGGE